MARRLVVRQTRLPDVLVVEPQVFRDDRGHLLETWQSDAYAEIGIIGPFVQDVLSHSSRGVLRGLHFQEPHPQGKLICVVNGAIFDVAVDVRCGSEHFGQWTAAVLSSVDRHQMWVPPGFAHGYLTISAAADVLYKCTDLYTPAAERAIAWNDTDIGIDWPALDGVPILSGKDRAAPSLADATELPVFGE